MCELIELLVQCQRDTLDILGEGAAGRLSNWANHRNDLPRLIRFIQERIHSDTWENGAKLELNNRMSLERIVVTCGEPTFAAQDIERAQATLQMAPFFKS
jgi:hypothetical protein